MASCSSRTTSEAFSWSRWALRRRHREERESVPSSPTALLGSGRGYREVFSRSRSLSGSVASTAVVGRDVPANGRGSDVEGRGIRAVEEVSECCGCIRGCAATVHGGAVGQVAVASGDDGQGEAPPLRAAIVALSSLVVASGGIVAGLEEPAAVW